MNPRRTVAVALALATLLPVLFSLMTGCQDSPPEPVFDNPFDPGSPSGGDALNIRAYYGGGVVTVIWDHLDGFNISSYDVDRSLVDQSSWEPMAFDLPISPTSWIDSTAVPNVVHYYKVQAKTADGSFTISSYIVAAEVETPPFVDASPAGRERPSRYLDLKIVAGQGDSVRVASDSTFAGAAMYPAAAAGETLTVPWDLGPQAANDDTMYVHVESFGGSYVSARADLMFLVGFAPPFTVQDMSEAGTVATQAIVLEIPDYGVEFMRFASSEAELDAATPVPGAATYPWLLTNVLAPQSVWGRFDGDFGFSSDVELVVLPDQLTDATFSLDLPDNGVISIPEVTVLSNAVATEMRFTDNGDFTDVPWKPYAASSIENISSTVGVRSFNAQYRNFWTNTVAGSLVDTFEFVATDLSIVFYTPEPDEFIAGGDPYLITGRAVVADGGPLSDLQIDVGDGEGFKPISPRQEYWTYSADVPRFHEDKPLVLRARAWSGTDSVTTTVSVTVTQLAVAVSEPAGGEVLGANTAVTIAGTATPPLAGNVDSVTVYVDGARQDVTGILDWSVDGWTTPDVTISTPVAITATAWAAGDTAQMVVDVTVDPATR